MYQLTMMDGLTGFQRDLLYVIASFDGESPPHGLAIKDEIEKDYAGEINHGRLYPNLDTLLEMGLIEKGTIDKRTNSYELSQRGRRELETRREWESERVDLTTA
jgi:PadR family transcriptional regulator PadR